MRAPPPSAGPYGAPMGHDTFDALAVGWALDALDPEDHVTFERHRADGCPRCDEEVSATLELAVELAFALPQPDPPPEMRARVLAAASPPEKLAVRLVEPSGDERPEPAPQPHSGRHRAAGRSRWSSGLIAAGLAVVVGVGGWQVATRERGAAPSATASADRVAVLAARDGADPVATVLLETNQATVVTSALPPSSAGRSYVLWGLPAGGGPPQALGAFAVSATGLHSHKVALRHPGDAYKSLALSKEPAGTLPAAPSKVLALGALTR